VGVITPNVLQTASPERAGGRQKQKAGKAKQLKLAERRLVKERERNNSLLSGQKIPPKRQQSDLTGHSGHFSAPLFSSALCGPPSRSLRLKAFVVL
jgi:hypothetical protein